MTIPRDECLHRLQAISEPEDAQYILEHTRGVVGFFGASSIERLPTEVAITGCVRRFKEMKASPGSH